MSHVGYFDHEADSTPLPQYVEAKEAKAKALRSFKRGMFLGAVAMAVGIFAAEMAYSETIQIGGMRANGTATGGSPVTIAPSDQPGVLAVVTIINVSVNEARDNGAYPLTLDELTIQVEFSYNVGPAQGADRFALVVPDGITCDPADCTVTLIEGFTGSVTLYDWRGM